MSFGHFPGSGGTRTTLFTLSLSLSHRGRGDLWLAGWCLDDGGVAVVGGGWVLGDLGGTASIGYVGLDGLELGQLVLGSGDCQGC